MINHVRTLLLNRDGSTSALADYPGEEYVPGTFHAKTLSPELTLVRQLLLGQRPDRAFLNWRLRELLAVLHATELAEHVAAPDPRVTYWPGSPLLFDLVAAGPTVVELSPGGDLLLDLNANVEAEGEQLYHEWSINVIDGLTVEAQALRGVDGPGPVVSSSYTITAGSSNVLTLPGTAHTYRFTSGVGAIWNVKWLGRPATTLADVLAGLDGGLGNAAKTALFGVPLVEPYRTFANLYMRHPRSAYRIGGLALALAYRTGEVEG
jgi:hypothetical protein